MATILGVLNKMKALNTDQVIIASVSETADSYANLNAEQMNKGLNAEGAQIGQYASEQYAQMKYAQNPVPGFGVVDLRLTGDFYGGIKTEVQNDRVITESTDPKNAELVEKYGPIFGLDDRFRREYLNENLRPAFKARVQAETGLTMH